MQKVLTRQCQHFYHFYVDINGVTDIRLLCCPSYPQNAPLFLALALHTLCLSVHVKNHFVSAGSLDRGPCDGLQYSLAKFDTCRSAQGPLSRDPARTEYSSPLHHSLPWPIDR
jgi:hypothetical protein